MPDQVTFTATLHDDVTPNLEKLEKQLKQLGMTPAQVKMVISAVDEATPKIKAAQEHVNSLPKQRQVHLEAVDEATPKIKKVKEQLTQVAKSHKITVDMRAGVDNFRSDMQKAREEFTKPMIVPFRLIDPNGNSIEQATSKFNALRTSFAGYAMASPIGEGVASMVPGAGAAAGMVAGGGALAGAAALGDMLKESFQQNVEMEQAHQKLSITLRDTAGATTELNKVIAANVKSPYTFQQTLQADVLGRSYQAPVFPGENPKVPQGYLNIASNMAAAMGSTPDDAMMAISMARQHLFRRLNMYGIRMTAADFGSAGRYAGMSTDQALEVATRRFQGAMGAQMKTFPGMVSNIKDVANAQIIRPLGQNLFGAIEGRTGNIENALGTDRVKRQIGDAVQQFQHLTVEVLQSLQKIKQYFEVHLKQPLQEIVHLVKTVGGAFTTAFGGAAMMGLNTFAEAVQGIMNVLQPIVKIAPVFGTMFGYMKGMQAIGMGGMVRPMQSFANIFNPASPTPMHTNLTHAIGGLPGMAFKTMGFFAIKEFRDAQSATININHQFQNMHGHMNDIYRVAAATALEFGKSDISVRNLVSAAAQGIPTTGRGAPTPQSRAQLSLQTARAGLQLGHITGWDPNTIMRSIQADQKSANDFTVGSLRKFGTELLQAAAVAKQFGVNASQAMQIMATFAPQAGPIGLGGLHGLPSVIAMSQTMQRLGVSSNQIGAGLYTSDAVTQAIMGQYGAPTIQALRKIPSGQLGQYWNFQNRPSQVAKYGKDEATYEQQARGAAGAQQSAMSDISQLAPSAIGGQYGIPKIPTLWNSAGLATDFSQFNKPGQTGAQTAEKVKQAWSATADNFAKAQNAIADYGAKIDQTTNYIDQLNQAQSSVNLQMQAFQHMIQVQQRGVEDASLSIQQYTFDNLRPLERELTRIQNVMDQVNHTMTDAQYNMTKFADGLLTGEQAALNQLHALSLYNEQLNYLKMQYTQIGAQLGTQVYERGYSARVGPLMGLSLEMQMQQLQRRQQLAQSKYDITYGEGHYQMQQAQRTIWQKTEMPLNQRLRGITQNQGAIDQATIKAHNLSETQFSLQQKMFGVNEVIADQQDNLTKLQLALTRTQQSPALRSLEDQQYNLGQKIGYSNIQLNKQQKIMDQWQNTLDDLNQKKQDLQSLFDSLLVFNTKGPNQFTEARQMIQLAGQTGLLPGGHWTGGGLTPRPAGHSGPAFQTPRTWVPGPQEKALLGAVDTAQRTAQQAQKAHPQWYHDRGSVVKAITAGILGIFTGSTIRNMSHLVSQVPIIGGMLGDLVNAIGFLAPGITALVGILTTGATLAWAGRHALTHVIPKRRWEGVAGRLQGIGTSMTERYGEEGIRGRIGARLGAIEDAGDLRNIVAGGSWWDQVSRKFEMALHPIREWRRIVGGAGGAALGTAVSGGNPFVSWLTRMGGAKLGEEIPARDVARGVLEVGQTVRGARSLADFRPLADSIVSGITRSRAATAVGGIATTIKGTIQDPLIVGVESGERARLGGAAADFAYKSATGAAGWARSATTTASTAARSVRDSPAVRTVTDSAAAQNIRQGGKDIVQGAKNVVRGATQGEKNAAKDASNVKKVDEAASRMSTAGRELYRTPGALRAYLKEFDQGVRRQGTIINREGGHVDKFGKHISSQNDNFRTRLGEARDIIKKDLGGEITTFGEDVGDKKGFGRFVGFLGGHVGRFGRYIGNLSAIITAVELFKTVIEHFQGWFGNLISHLHIPGVPSDVTGPAHDAPRVGSDASKIARGASDLYKSNPTFRKTVDAARKAGATAIRWGGRLLRFGGYAAGALSFIPAAESLVAGDVQKGVGQAANAATYFLPGLGEARAFNDLLQGTGVLPTTTPGGPEGRISTPTSGVTAAVQHFLGGGGPSHSVNRPLRTDATPSYNESNTAASINASVMIDNNVIPVAYKKGENYYADEIKALQQYLSTHKNLSKKAYQDITNQINNDRKKQNDVQQQWYKTDRQHQQAYEQLSAADQIQAQTWALNGPNGLVNYLDTINTHLNSHWSSRLKGTQTAYTNENAAHNIGYKSISGTTGHWLGSLKSQIDGWSKQMGLPLSDTAKPGHVTTSGQGVGSAASSAVSAVSTAISVPANLFGGKEHGGLVELEKHHQLGHGRMVRMVEEGHPEMVIPLAPHRRDHAKNLLKHTTSLLGMEHGGVVHKDHHRRIRENIPKIKPLVNKAGQIVKHGDIRAPGFATGGYVWPYGPGITSGRIDEGWDMGGTGPIAAIGNTGPLMQGQPGWPGTGQGFYYQLKDGIRAGQYVYVYENVQRLKPLGYQAKAGEILANLLSGYPYLESGWATSSGAPTSQGQYSDGTPMPQGYDFQRFLTGLQHGQLIGGGEGGAGIPAPKLKLPPALLKKMGIVGPRQFAILNKWLKNWQTSLNTRADTGGTAGSTAGLSGPLKTMVGQIAQRMSWDGSQVQDWLRVISMESNGTITDTNPSSGAYGIAQMLAPGGSPTNLGPNKQKYYMYGGDPNTMAGQLLGMANYIKQTYQNPANALAFHLAHNWYAGGIPRVPRDNTPAILHQDEMVIPAAMAHAARAQAGQGHPMMQHGTLKGDPGWLNFEKNYMKHLTSILVIQDDIHRVRKHMDNFDQGNKKATGQDTAMLRNLNAALRAARARQLGAHNPSTNAAISHALRSIHDPSGGESTLAGVTTEKAHYNRMVYNYTHSSPALVRAQTKLHRDQTHLHAAHSHLTQVQHQIAKHHGHITQGQRRTLAGIHKTITREQKAVRLDQASVHKIQDALKKNVGRETQHAQAAYIVQAATRGINAGLMKSITGKKLTSQETRQYQKLANATAHGADKNSKAVKAMEKQLTKELLSTTKQQVAGHKKTQTTVGKVHKAVGDSVANTNKNHSDVKAHHTKHENHMKKTEDHHKKMEARMDALLRKPTTVNIVNNITGATVKTTRMPQRARSR